MKILLTRAGYIGTRLLPRLVEEGRFYWYSLYPFHALFSERARNRSVSDSSSFLLRTKNPVIVISGHSHRKLEWKDFTLTYHLIN